jgi:RNA polymerase sigma-70 factor (ECF subfamily)
VSPTPSEAATLAALRRGDEAAFTALVGRHHAAMLRLATGFVRNRATAEEVVQESWLGFLTGLDRFEARSTIRTFLLTIVANKARTRAQRDARSVPVSALAGDDGPDDSGEALDRLLAGGRSRSPEHWMSGASAASDRPDGRLLGRETLQVLHDAIDLLPPRQRVVILLHDVHGLSSAETRQVLGLTEGNQRVLLHRARTRVRAAVRTYLDEPAAA